MRPRTHTPESGLLICWTPSSNTSYKAMLPRHWAFVDAMADEASVRCLQAGHLYMPLAWVDHGDVVRLGVELKAALGGVRPFTFTVGGTVVGDTTIVHDTDIDNRPNWPNLLEAIGTVGRLEVETCMTAAVGVGEADSGVIADRLRRAVRQAVTPVRLDRLAVVTPGETLTIRDHVLLPR